MSRHRGCSDIDANSCCPRIAAVLGAKLAPICVPGIHDANIGWHGYSLAGAKPRCQWRLPTTFTQYGLERSEPPAFLVHCICFAA